MKLLQPKQAITLPLPGGQCIECAAKARGRTLSEKILSGDMRMNEAEEMEFELLQRFVTEVDVEKLMQSDPLLDGRTGVALVIEETALGRLKVKAVQMEKPSDERITFCNHEGELDQ